MRAFPKMAVARKAFPFPMLAFPMRVWHSKILFHLEDSLAYSMMVSATMAYSRRVFPSVACSTMASSTMAFPSGVAYSTMACAIPQKILMALHLSIEALVLTLHSAPDTTLGTERSSMKAADVISLFIFFVFFILMLF